MLKLNVALRAVACNVEFSGILFCVFDDGVRVFELAVFIDDPDERIDLEIADIGEIVHIEGDIFTQRLYEGHRRMACGAGRITVGAAPLPPLSSLFCPPAPGLFSTTSA